MFNNNVFLILQLSDDVLWGFRCYFPVKRLVNDVEVNKMNIAEFLRLSLLDMLSEHNIVYLIEKYSNVRFHVHNLALDHDIIYVCSCSN
jgi:hypothetical protein